MPFDDVSKISLSQIELPIFFRFVQNGYDLLHCFNCNLSLARLCAHLFNTFLSSLNLATTLVALLLALTSVSTNFTLLKTWLLHPIVFKPEDLSFRD
jgi:hypothetical protein